MINNMNQSINSTVVHPGTILSTSRGFYRHFGIATDNYVNGQPMVISNSGAHGRVVEESLEQFQGQGDIKNEGYWGKLPYQEVLARARKKLGSSYSLLDWNCEHFVRLAHGLKPESPQVAFVAVLCVGVLFAVGLSRA
jgi:hypothetical protein